MTRLPLHVLVLGVIAAALTGCVTTPRHPANAVHHAVFISLKDKADLPAMAADSEELRKIPGIIDLAVGFPLDSKREKVVRDYDFGLYVEFDSAAAYEGYVTHPIHQRLLQKWAPKFQDIHIRDFGGQGWPDSRHPPK